MKEGLHRGSACLRHEWGQQIMDQLPKDGAIVTLNAIAAAVGCTRETASRAISAMPSSVVKVYKAGRLAGYRRHPCLCHHEWRDA